jgi:hypothetical protein
MAGGGYDISQSTSESNTFGFNKRLGDFNVGGGIRIPSWTWPVALVVVGLIVIVWLKRK